MGHRYAELEHCRSFRPIGALCQVRGLFVLVLGCLNLKPRLRYATDPTTCFNEMLFQFDDGRSFLGHR